MCRCMSARDSQGRGGKALTFFFLDDCHFGAAICAAENGEFEAAAGLFEGAGRLLPLCLLYAHKSTRLQYKGTYLLKNFFFCSKP